MATKTPKAIRIPRYCLHKATGQAYVTLSGREHYLGKYTLKDGQPDCPEYHRLIAEWLTNNRTLPATTEKKDGNSVVALTIVELVARYWTHAQSYYKGPDGKPTGELEAVKQAMKPLNRLFGHTPAQDFGPKRLKTVRDEMKGMGWCRTNINRQVARVRQCFRWGVGEELIPGAVDHALRAVTGLRRNPHEVRESEKVLPVPEPAIDAVLPFVSRQVSAMIQLQRLTGMRSGEVTIMRAIDLDMSGETWIYKPSTHKTAHKDIVRMVYLGAKCQAIVRPFLNTKTTAYLFDPRDAEEERSEARRLARKTPMTPSQRARDKKTDSATGKLERYSVASYRRAIARACDEAFPLPVDLPEEKRAGWRGEHRWHPHQLRHTAATNLKKQFGWEGARVVLGHDSAITTSEYVEKDFDKARSIMAEVG